MDRTVGWFVDWPLVPQPTLRRRGLAVIRCVNFNAYDDLDRGGRKYFGYACDLGLARSAH
jgi:hypothetical protein